MTLPLGQYQHRFLRYLAKVDFLPSLAIRLFLAPVFITAGLYKFRNLEGTIAWFGNSDWGLGLPMPEILATFTAGLELVGGVALVIGLGVRWFSLLLFLTMIAAAVTAHWDNGWQMIGDPSWFGSNERVEEGARKLARAKSILREHGNYRWLTSSGSIVILNNGIEKSITYAIMCLALVFSGAGRYLSVDYWIARRTGEQQN